MAKADKAARRGKERMARDALKKKAGGDAGGVSDTPCVGQEGLVQDYAQGGVLPTGGGVGGVMSGDATNPP